MERTESIIIPVAPDYENAKIKEMEMFGWNLQSRQEIQEAGEAYAEPSLIGGGYIIKTKVSQYVKLHFVRSLALPNLDRVREIELEYFGLPFPTPTPPRLSKPSLLIGGCLGYVTFSFVFGGILGIVLIIFVGLGAPNGGLFLIGLFLIGLAASICLFLWRKARKEKEAARKEEEAARQICEQSQRRAEELLVQLKTLTPL